MITDTYHASYRFLHLHIFQYVPLSSLFKVYLKHDISNPWRKVVLCIICKYRHVSGGAQIFSRIAKINECATHQLFSVGFFLF